MVKSLSNTLKEIENSRQAIINSGQELSIEEQKMLYKVNGHLGRIHKELLRYRINKLNI